MALPIVFALALSFDGLFVGIAYGMRRITIPRHSLVIIAGCTMVGMSISMLLGHFFGDLISERMTQILGAVILSCIGLWHLFNGWLDYMRAQMTSNRHTLWRMHVDDIHIVVRILRKPTLADTDRSGTIEAKEAFVLGAALGMDAFAAGFAASLLSFNALLLIPLVTLGQPLLTLTGIQLGKRYGNRYARGKGLFLPGVLLCVLAIMQL